MINLTKKWIRFGWSKGIDILLIQNNLSMFVMTSAYLDLMVELDVENVKLVKFGRN
jgi:hypothetical protein